MHFLLENTKELDMERILLEEQLKKYRFLHTYETIEIPRKCQKNVYPVGTIPFVENCLQLHENPIEIPKYLRTDEFLKRDYQIVKWDAIPRNGNYFLKDVSKLKNFGKIVNADYEINDELFAEDASGAVFTLSKTSDYLVSSLFSIETEYRVYVFQGEIEQISYYNGDCTVFPDMNLIKKAISLINYHEKWLRSYTIDVMVGKTGTALIEIHNFTSCGLYSTLWGENLIQAYADGIRYLRNDNKKLER